MPNIPERTEADLVLMCPLAEELEALRRAFESVGAASTHVGGCDWWAEVAGGRGGVVQILIHGPLADMGRVPAALAASRLLERWRPEQLWLVGIAGGLGPDVCLGDVLVGEQTIDYALHKVDARSTKSRPRAYPSDRSLLAMARDHAQQSRGKVHFGVIASGDGVVTRPGHVKKQVGEQHKLIGVEMEAAGVVAAVHEGPSRVAFMHIRGVSDLADPAKNAPETKQFRIPACEAAARFAVSFVSRAFGGSSTRAEQLPAEPRPDRASAPASASHLVIVRDGAELPWVTTEPAGLPALFTLNMPDPQWGVGGHGTGMEIDLTLESVDALRNLLDAAVGVLELAEDGAFAIHQRGSVWLGVGSASLVEAVRAAPSRYATLAPNALHHSEQLSYFASIRGGWFLLTAQYSAHLGRLHHARVEVGLSGVPLDSAPYLAFVSACGSSDAFFTTGTSSIVRERRVGESPRLVRARGRVIEVDDETGEAWVRALIIDNPAEELRRLGDDGIGVRRGSTLAFARLLHHHPAEAPPDRYHIHSAELLEAAGTLVVHYVCSW